MLFVRVGAVVKVRLFVAVPREAPAKLTAAPAPVWARLAAPNVRLPPLLGFRLTVENPLTTLTAPRLSAVLVEAVLLPVKVKVPPARLTAAAALVLVPRRLLELLVVL